ncbi:hypothetical protein GCM10017044_21740 [Kordiimonas sediminis]|uniref:DUF1330 domain-containing protein n=1 Tax=Kordiimonas sediminis TaxID=1735581 RepID=A0A919E7G3_9PROT|nr:DUF1330 domain-containing protein [Kordiimonas sediminis]GHF26438.1 hypothetical protein GCM10017044_21740 [Kordiimonas sediminis]
MKRTPYIDPEREQFEVFKNLPRDEPIHMLNLIKFKDKATYEDGRDMSGADAYAAYGRESGPVFSRVGGKIIWRGIPQVMLIGPDHMVWDQIFVAWYPHAGAFLEMVTDPAYKIAVKHRQAGVEDSRLIRCSGSDVGSSF